jgi:RNA polymerase sigma-70 factor, ECF subfamily
MERDEEKKLVEEARKNPEAFSGIFEAYYPAILRYVLHRTGNAAAADDITSEVFFKALNKLSSFRWAGVPFSSWLYRIAGNETIDFFRRQSHEPKSYDAFETPLDIPDISSRQDIENEMIRAQDDIDNNAKYIEVKQALKTLPQKYQEVLVLRFLEDKKISEIADVLGKNEGTIKSLISRGVDRLKKYFDGKTQPLEGGFVIPMKDNLKGEKNNG